MQRIPSIMQGTPIMQGTSPVQAPPRYRNMMMTILAGLLIIGMVYFVVSQKGTSTLSSSPLSTSSPQSPSGGDRRGDIPSRDDADTRHDNNNNHEPLSWADFTTMTPSSPPSWFDDGNSINNNDSLMTSTSSPSPTTYNTPLPSDYPRGLTYTCTGQYSVSTVNEYTLLTFTGNGTLQVHSGVTPLYYLLIGGGGGGGEGGGGGGAGQVVASSPTGGLSFPYQSEVSYTIVIGQGGGGGISTNGILDAIDGGTSTIAQGSTILKRALGGGAGASRDTNTRGGVGNPGGNGGGGSSVANVRQASRGLPSGHALGSGGDSLVPDGFSGGDAILQGPYYSAGGGGGASEKGSSAIPVTGGRGGRGYTWPITQVTYAGGGGGGSIQGTSASFGGEGGGGRGGYGNDQDSTGYGQPGTPNTGSGGGGSGGMRNGGHGGSGICIFAFLHA